MKKLVLTILIMSGMPAYAGNDGGGGGMLCKDINNCMTLAEAGLRIKTEPDSASAPKKPAVSYEVMQEMDSIINGLPVSEDVKQMLKYRVDLPITSYESVEYYDAKKFKKIVEEYTQILSENKFPDSNLTIAAISNYEKTYLLPEFLKLNTHSQALMLIHEGVVRTTGSVRKALELDGHIVDALNGAQNSYGLTRSIVGLGYDNLKSSVKYVVASYIRDQQTNFGKKYKLSSQIVNELDGGVDLKEDLYISNELYNQYPDLWKVLITSGVNYLRISRSDRPVFPDEIKKYNHSNPLNQYSDDEALIMNGFIDKKDIGFCKNIEAGTYLSGNNFQYGNYSDRSGEITLITCSANKIKSVNGLRLIIRDSH